MKEIKKFFKEIKKFFHNPIKEIRQIQDYDTALIFVVAVLLLIGFYFSISITPVLAKLRYGYAHYSFLMKHILFIFAGTVCFFVAAFCVDYNILKNKKIKWAILISTLFILVFVLVLGKKSHGATRWIALGPFTLQPSEFAKLTFAILVVDFLSKKKDILKDFSNILVPGIYLIVFCGLITLQKDLGTIVFIGLIWLILLNLSGLKLIKTFLIAIFLGTVVAIPLIIKQPYRLKRMFDYSKSFLDFTKASENVQIAANAFGSGGVFGKLNTEVRLQLPEMHTDFIFPVIGEEWGFLGVIILCFLFLFLFYRALKISKNSKDLFGKMLAFILGAMILIQAFINMGMSIGLLPTKGMPLPFISYGGSSMIYSLLVIGLLVNISKNGRKKYYG
jgi:cell division protein FtsW